MALTPEQVKELKKQLSEQIKNVPEGQRKQAQEQIDNMSDAALETMLKQQGQSGGGQKGVFRAIVDGEIPAKRIDENKDAIAVISKMSVSKGHILVIPKKVVSDAKLLPAGVFGLAKKIAKKFASKLEAQSSEIQTESAFGEVVVHAIPVYDKPVNLGSERHEASEEEVEEVYSKLRRVDKPKTIRIKKETKKKAEVLKLRRRVP